MEKLVSQLRYDTGDEVYDRIFKNVLQSRSESEEQEPTVRKANLWRIIMKSRITKLTTAAVIIAAAVLVIRFSGGSVDLTTIAFADITEAMKNVPWMHQTAHGFGQASGPGEVWVGFESKTAAAKWANGKANFGDMKAHRMYQYEPTNNSLTIDYLYEDDFPPHLYSLVSAIEGMHKALKEQGAQITVKSGKRDGQPVQIQEIVLPGKEQDRPTQAVTLYIRPDSKLLLAADARVTDANGATITEGEIAFSYPASGPASIYDLGVPTDANVINNLPSNDYLSTWDKYRQCRAEGTCEYIAVITHADRSLGDIVTMVEVDYKSGRKQRWQRHSVFNMGEQFDKYWPQYKEQLGDSFESLLAWTIKDNEQGKGSSSVSIYDGRYSRHAVRKALGKDAGKWKYYRKQYSPDDPGMPTGSLGDLGWPYIGADGHILEDDFSKAKGLICIERLQQGSADTESITLLPARFLFYVDPHKDHICTRKVTERSADADWQQDKNWLDGVDSEKIRAGSITVEEVTEMTHAHNGHWYPKVIVVKQTGIRKDYKDAPLEVRTTKTIYLQTEPKFPDGIFDIPEPPTQ